MAATPSALDPARLQAVRDREQRQFAARTPVSHALLARAAQHLPNGVPMSWMHGLYRFPPIFASHGEGARFWDVDGNSYLDFNVCDLSMTTGFAQPRIAAAVSRAMSTGAHFLLPTQDAIGVAAELAARVGLPYWQFTLSASGANIEVLRIARAVTGRQKLIVFEGHYHGHIDETLVARDASGRVVSELKGLPAASAAATLIVPFNDLDAVEAALRGGEVALVLTEPALTNCTLVHPRPGFLAGLRSLTRRYGALLCYDEAHTFQFAYGGLVREWQLDTDFVVLGKGLGTGVSFGLYGMSDGIADIFVRFADIDIGPKGIATGGTTYGSTLAVAAAKAALQEVLTREGYARTQDLGRRLAQGLDGVFASLGLPWKAQLLGPRTGFCLSPTLPVNGAEAQRSLDTGFIDTRRLYLANRGIWDAIVSAGPQASFAHTSGDIDLYVAAVEDFLRQF